MKLGEFGHTLLKESLPFMETDSMLYTWLIRPIRAIAEVVVDLSGAESAGCIPADKGIHLIKAHIWTIQP